MTNQTQVSAELSEEQAEAMRAAYVKGMVGSAGRGIDADRRQALRAAYAASPAPAMAALITEMQADMSGKTVMSEEVFRELHGKAERLSALEAAAQMILACDREALANHRPKWGIADCIDNDGVPYQSHALGDALQNLRTLLTKEQTRG